MHPASACHDVLRLRLLIARAAQRDSLAWWTDESLTPGANTLLGRVFPRSADRARVRLALRAGLARHRGVLAREPGAIHLFDLGGAAEFAIDRVLLGEELPTYPSAPITSRGALRRLLTDAGVKINGVEDFGDAYSNDLAAPHVVEVAVSPGQPLAEVAVALAAAYLRGPGDAAVYPFAPGVSLDPAIVGGGP